MLFDTSVFIDYLRQSNSDARSYIESVIDGPESGSYSVITEAELWTGVRNRRDEIEVAALLANFESINLNSSVARRAGNLLFGKTPDEIKAHFGDALIAASAMEVGETILTADSRSQRVFGDKADYLVYR